MVLTSRHPSRFTVFALAAAFCANDASAQTTDCMAMGANMVNCKTSGPNGLSTTTCTGMGGGMATCNTMGPPPVPSYTTDDSAPRQGHGLVSFLAAAKERSVRKHVGERMAAGDCQGAAQYALANGRLELAEQVQRACQTAPAVGTGSSLATKASLADMITREVARLRRVPMAAARKPGLINIEALNNQILITLRYGGSKAEFTDEAHRAMVNELCSEAEYTPLLQRGASIRYAIVGMDNKDMGSVIVTPQACGF